MILELIADEDEQAVRGLLLGFFTPILLRLGSLSTKSTLTDEGISLYNATEVNLK